MRKTILLTMMASLICVAIAYAQTVPADKESIDLQKAWNVQQTQKGVLFNHGPHVAKLSKCDSCHSTPTGDSKITITGEIKGANNMNGAHNFCWTCHDQTPKPNKTPGKACTKCHVIPK